MTEYQFFGVLFFGFILLLILFAFVLDFSEKYKNKCREQELQQWQHKRNKKHEEYIKLSDDRIARLNC